LGFRGFLRTPKNPPGYGPAVAYKQTDANRLTNHAKRYARVCRCKAELGSSDSALDAGCEQVPPDVTSQMLDLEQQLLYVRQFV